MDATDLPDRLIAVLLEARRFLARPENDFTWSWWRGGADALAEIDGLVGRLRSGSAGPSDVAVLFAPSGPIQEVSLGSGWSRDFLALADRLDAALRPELREETLHLVARTAFSCGACGEEAAVLELRASGRRGEVRRASFTGTLEVRVTGDAVERLRAALTSRDAAAVFAVDLELAPFYCPACDESYCGRHWDRRDVFDDELPGWHDSIRGRCPRGHERMLED